MYPEICSKTKRDEVSYLQHLETNTAEFIPGLAISLPADVYHSYPDAVFSVALFVLTCFICIFLCQIQSYEQVQESSRQR